ncbi:hypothetical protein WKI65_43225 [Streptomyces sp. MS1.AVA.3]|uniref:hypothetical protein n=1 Tax=Streptomyces decoyicus TaxID=249567 RepID=UPI0030BF9C3C
MSTLLLGRWDWGGDLVIEESHQIEDGDAAADALVEGQDDERNDAWACTFDVDRHSDAVQCAYEEYVAHEGTRLIDEVDGYEPATDSAAA